MREINKQALAYIRGKYQPGTKIELVEMRDEQAVPAGTIGEVLCVDDMGTIHVKWATGSTLGLIPTVDSYRVLEEYV